MANQAKGSTAEAPSNIPSWHVYILRTARGALYTGITTDVERRTSQHRAGRGAKALRGDTGLHVVYQAPVGSMSLALRLELRIKRLSKEQKEALVGEQPTPLELGTALLEVPDAADLEALRSAASGALVGATR